jgi:SAM-dependent methyltransferase
MTETLSSTVLMPEGPMRRRVAGTDDLEWFHVSGRMTCGIYEAALASVGRRLDEFHRIFDFGCGVGRVLRWLKARTPDAQFAGADSDEAAIEWMRGQYPDVEMAVITNNGLPPLPFNDAAFDLVVGYSVFTHLDERYQDEWLAELRRIVAPRGMLLLSISGPRMLDHTLTKSDHANLADLRSRVTRFEQDGILHWRGDGWEQLFPDYYHTTFHTHAYIRRHWSRWFAVLGIHTDTPSALAQDIVILRRS